MRAVTAGLGRLVQGSSAPLTRPLGSGTAALATRARSTCCSSFFSTSSPSPIMSASSQRNAQQQHHHHQAKQPRSEAEVNAETDAERLALEDRVQKATEELVAKGYDRRLIWRQEVCWGDHDTFQHVNNVRYVRWYESARMLWGQTMAQYIDDPKRRNDILRGTGESFILAGINVRYRRPLLYPDTVLVAQTVALPISEERFTISAVAYSVNQGLIASSAEQLCVMYDYTKLKKCAIPEDLRKVMQEQGERTASNQAAAAATATGASPRL